METEQATLLDVFEKAHIIKQFRLTEDGASETGNNSVYTIKRLSEDGSEEETEEEQKADKTGELTPGVKRSLTMILISIFLLSLIHI